jgi:PIN domain nuclease of toxin-antitoxin system
MAAGPITSTARRAHQAHPTIGGSDRHTRRVVGIIHSSDHTADRNAPTARALIGADNPQLLLHSIIRRQTTLRRRDTRCPNTPAHSDVGDRRRKVLLKMKLHTEVPIDAILASRLPWDHKDPFDRVLVADAARRILAIATSDTHIVRIALTPTLKT